MERSEPSFVPEWLKGANGSCNNSTTYQSDSQSHQGVHREFDSPRSFSASDRVLHPHPRRILSNNTSLIERATLDRDAASQSRLYSTYNRSSSYRSLDGSKRERSGRGECEYGQEREMEPLWERERDRVLGFGNGDERERYHESLDDSLHQKHSASAPGRYDVDASSKRTSSLGSPNRSLGNGSPRHVVESVVLLGGPSVSSDILSSNIHKAAFERNFPSLGSQEKPGLLQSSLGDVSALSVRPFRQGSLPKVDVAHTPSTGLASSSSGIVSVSATGSAAAESLRGISTEAPVSAGNLFPSNGLAIASLSKVMSGTVAAPAVGGISVSQQGVPKMAEALLQNASRVRIPPQQSTESQRLEELAFKQSRQLIPMKPLLPKTMGLSPRDKPKARIGRALDAPMTVAPNLNQSKISPQPLSALYRAPTAMRSEASKPQPGMLVVQKTSKDALSGVTAGKLDASSPSQVSTFSNSSVGVIAGSSSVPNSGGNFSRKPKQFLGLRVMAETPASSASDGKAMTQLKDGLTGVEDKKLSFQSRNRSAFFNALRRKAAGASGNASIIVQVPDIVPKQKSEEMGSVEVEFCRSRNVSNSLGNAFDKPIVKVQKNDASCNADQRHNRLDNTSCDEQNKYNSINGDILEGTKDIMQQTAATNNSDDAMNMLSVGGLEEEEAAFLRSLGWVENPDDGKEALTEEEISAFLREHMQTMSSRRLCSMYSLRLEKLGVYTDKAGSKPSCNGSLDVEFDVKACI